MRPIITAKGVSKQYRIGGPAPSYLTLRDALSGALRGPVEASRRRGGRPGWKAIWALKDVSFDVWPGEVVGIIGSNGAGKSTLLKILSRIVEPTAGRVELYGRVGSLLEVGTGFHPELTGRENIFLNGAMLGMRRAEVVRKFDEIVAFSEIEQFIDTPVKWYSSGMYTRLAFAVAAHLEPEVLIVDEVLAVGDAAFQKKCLGKMGDVAKGGRTVLFVSHNLTAVKGLCERAIWLAKGSVVEDGPAGHVVSAYLQGVTCHMLEQVWDDPATAPGNEKTRILSARVRPLVAGEDAQISVETPLSLEFEFWNYLPGAVLNFTAHLFTADGTCVFAAPSEGRPRPAGPFGVAVQIPADLLNDGTYSVAIQVIQDTASTLYYHPDVLTFTVHDAGRGGSWFGKWPGVVRPKLEWVSGSAGEGRGER